MPTPARYTSSHTLSASTHRQNAISRVQATLAATGFPRLKMLLIVSLTGGAGFLASFLLLRGGLTSMAWRYPASVGVAYLVFLFMLWLWLRTSADDYTDIPDLAGSLSPRGGVAECQVNVGSVGEEGGAMSEIVDGVAQADELAIPLLGIIALVALALSSVWIVYSAPALFAELLIDGVLSATLYRRLRGIETRHWLETAVRRTVIPFALTAAIASLCGVAMHHYHPAANSLGDVIHGERSNG